MENYQILSRIIYQLMVIVIINEYRWLSWSSLGILRHQMKKMFETCATQTSKESFDPNARFTMSPRAKPLEAPTEAPTEAPMDPGIKVGWWQKRTSSLETQSPLQLTVVGAILVLESRDPKGSFKSSDQVEVVLLWWDIPRYSNIGCPCLPNCITPKTRPSMPPFQEPMPKVQPEEVWVLWRFRQQGLVSSRPNMPSLRQQSPICITISSHIAHFQISL